MAYKLMTTASLHYRSVDQPDLVAKVRAGIRFVNGVGPKDPQDPNSEGDAA
jgi:hypothetical protein